PFEFQDEMQDAATIWLSEDERALLIDAIDSQLNPALGKIASTADVAALESYQDQLALVLDAFGLLGLGDWSALGDTIRAEIAVGAMSGEANFSAAIREAGHWQVTLKMALLDPGGEAWKGLLRVLASPARAAPLAPEIVAALERTFAKLRIGE